MLWFDFTLCGGNDSDLHMINIYGFRFHDINHPIKRGSSVYYKKIPKNLSSHLLSKLVQLFIKFKYCLLKRLNMKTELKTNKESDIEVGIRLLIR